MSDTEAISYFLNRTTGTDQMVVVVSDGSTYGATLYYYTKESGSWEYVFETYSVVGMNGMADHTYEGDVTTPVGRYDLGLAFGIKSDPGTSLPWLDVTDDLYWVDDTESDYFNMLVSSYEVSTDNWASAEHLIDHANAYNYAINIEVNPECSKDCVSAIFLHVFSSYVPYTLGCVAISEERMVDLLLDLEVGAQITIVRNTAELANYMY